MNKSTFLSLNLRDLARGFAMAVISALLTGIAQPLLSGKIDITTLKTIGLVALGSGVSYLIKNGLTNSDDKFMKSE